MFELIVKLYDKNMGHFSSIVFNYEVLLAFSNNEYFRYFNYKSKFA